MWALICGLLPTVVLTIIVSTSGDVSGGMSVFLVLIWFVASIIAIVTGGLCIRAASRGRATNNGMGVTGLVLGIIFLAFLIIAIAFGVAG